MTTLSQARPAHSALTVVSRRLDALRLNPRSPRLNSKRQIRQIARSIETFGFNVPVLVDGANQVVAGHGRVLACRELGWDEVPTIHLDHLSDAQVQAFMIADNRLSELSTWDDQQGVAHRLQATHGMSSRRRRGVMGSNLQAFVVRRFGPVNL